MWNLKFEWKLFCIVPAIACFDFDSFKNSAKILEKHLWKVTFLRLKYEKQALHKDLQVFSLIYNEVKCFHVKPSSRIKAFNILVAKWLPLCTFKSLRKFVIYLKKASKSWSK